MLVALATQSIYFGAWKTASLGMPPVDPVIPPEAFKLSRMFSGKFAEVIAIGQPVTPVRAVEILRRTDVFFWGGPAGREAAWPPLRDFARELDRSIGFPSAWRYPADKPPDRLEHRKLVKFWCERWGALDTQYLFNQQIASGSGFCHPGGEIVWAEEVSRYPSGTDLLRDLRLIAEAFPDLSVDMAVWCDQRGAMLGFPLEDRLKMPWPAEMLAKVAEPTVGFLLRGGVVTVVRGFDRRLFGDFGLRYPAAVERALAETRRLQAVHPSTAETGLKVRTWLTEAVQQDWAAQARALGLVR